MHSAYAGEQTIRSVIVEPFYQAAALGDNEYIKGEPQNGPELTQALLFAIGQRKKNVIDLLIEKH